MTKDVSADFGYYQLLGHSEKARWVFNDLPWDELDESKVDDTVIHNVKTAAFGEFTTYNATASFMRLFHTDIDFTQWIAVWFYEETKHPLSLIRYLGKLGVPTDEKFIHGGRQISPMLENKVDMLTANVCSEIAANTTYNHFLKMIDEPLLVEIIRNLGRDEMRHSNGFQFYLHKTIDQSEDPDGDRLRALRTTWFLLQQGSHGVTQHPVYLTTRGMKGIDADFVEQRIREKIVERMAKVLDLEIPNVDAVYDVYSRLKKDYRSSRKAVAAVA